jgi:hypothetical protein
MAKKDLDYNLSEHFTLREATQTSTGLLNTPPLHIFDKLVYVAFKMEIVRTYLDNHPIFVSSWYRSKAVNAAVGGAKKSEHLEGLAVDFICPEYGTPYEIARRLEEKRFELRFNKCIYEKKGGKEWVHVSFVIPPVTPCVACYTLMPNGTYADGIKFLGE